MSCAALEDMRLHHLLAALPLTLFVGCFGEGEEELIRDTDSAGKADGSGLRFGSYKLKPGFEQDGRISGLTLSVAPAGSGADGEFERDDLHANGREGFESFSLDGTFKLFKKRSQNGLTDLRYIKFFDDEGDEVDTYKWSYNDNDLWFEGPRDRDDPFFLTQTTTNTGTTVLDVTCKVTEVLVDDAYIDIKLDTRIYPDVTIHRAVGSRTVEVTLGSKTYSSDTTSIKVTRSGAKIMATIDDPDITHRLVFAPQGEVQYFWDSNWPTVAKMTCDM